jgi:hypothetical protein
MPRAPIRILLQTTIVPTARLKGVSDAPCLLKPSTV